MQANRILVRNPESLEKKIVDSLVASLRIPASIEPILPKWIGRLESSFWRFLRCVFTLLRERKILYLEGEIRPITDASADTTDLLFFSSGITSTRTTLPVANELAQSTTARISIVFPERLKAEVRRAFAGFSGRFRITRSIRPAPAFNLLLHLMRLGPWRRRMAGSSLTFEGTPVLEILKDSPTEFSDYSLGTVKTWIDFWERKLAAKPYSCVITGNDRDWRNLVVLTLAKRRGSTTVGIQDALFVDHPCLACTGSDHVLVGGEAVVEFLRKRGFASQEIHVTGIPRYDALVKDSHRSREEVFRDLGLDLQRSLLLVTTDHGVDPEEKRSEVRALIRAASHLKNAQILFKLHPYESDGVVASAIREIAPDKTFAIVQNYDIYDLLASADVVITRHSSTGVEAMVLGKPVIVLNLSGRPDISHYVIKEAAVGVYEAEALEGHLRRILENRKLDGEMSRRAESFVRHYIGPPDGKAAARAARLIRGFADIRA